MIRKIFLASVGTVSALFILLTLYLTPMKSAVSAPSDDAIPMLVKAPNFTLTTTEGKTISLSDFKGKGVIVNFWGTWCPPCRAEIPDMVELQKKYESENFTFIGVALERAKGEAAVNGVKAYMEKAGINYPIVMGNGEVFDSYQGLLPEEYRGAVPASFVINAQGDVIDSFVGSRDKDAFDVFIKRILPKKGKK